MSKTSKTPQEFMLHIRKHLDCVCYDGAANDISPLTLLAAIVSVAIDRVTDNSTLNLNGVLAAIMPVLEETCDVKFDIDFEKHGPLYNGTGAHEEKLDDLAAKLEEETGAKLIILDNPADLHNLLSSVLGEPTPQTHGTTRKPQ